MKNQHASSMVQLTESNHIVIVLGKTPEKYNLVWLIFKSSQKLHWYCIICALQWIFIGKQSLQVIWKLAVVTTSWCWMHLPVFARSVKKVVTKLMSALRKMGKMVRDTESSTASAATAGKLDTLRRTAGILKHIRKSVLSYWWQGSRTWTCCCGRRCKYQAPFVWTHKPYSLCLAIQTCRLQTWQQQLILLLMNKVQFVKPMQCMLTQKWWEVEKMLRQRWLGLGVRG